MAQEVAEYFNRFYSLVFRQQLNDPIIHSEWIYFLSMFKNTNIEKDRVELYLGILDNQKKKKMEKGSLHSCDTSDGGKSKDYKLKGKLSDDSNAIVPPQIKLQKRYSENWKANMSINQKINYESTNLKRLASMDQDSAKLSKTNAQDANKSISNKSIQNKSIQNKSNRNSEPIYALPTVPAPSNFYPYYTSMNLKNVPMQREGRQVVRNRKLCQISRRVLNVMQGNCKLRA